MRLYLPEILECGQKVTIADQAYNYIVRVLRKQEGDYITLFNGNGGEFYTTIEEIQKRHLTLSVNQFNPINRTSTIQIDLYQSLAKGEKLEFIFQKATELGVTTIIPIITERSVITIKEAQVSRRLERWNAIIHSSCEQCGLNIPPVLSPPISLSSLLQTSLPFPSLLLSPYAKQSLGHYLRNENSSRLMIFIGPEGGFSDSETQALIKSGATDLSLGSRILRTETAALSVISSIQAFSGDWKA